MHPNPYMCEVLRRHEIIGRLAAFDCEPVEYMPPLPAYKKEKKTRRPLFAIINMFLP